MFWNPETVSFGGRNPAEVDQAFGWEVSHTGHLWRLDEDPEAKNTTRPPIGEMGEYELGFPVSGITGCPEEHYFFFGSKHHKLNSSNVKFRFRNQANNGKRDWIKDLDKYQEEETFIHWAMFLFFRNSCWRTPVPLLEPLHRCERGDKTLKEKSQTDQQKQSKSVVFVRSRLQLFFFFFF